MQDGVATRRPHTVAQWLSCKMAPDTPKGPSEHGSDFLSLGRGKPALPNLLSLT